MRSMSTYSDLHIAKKRRFIFCTQTFTCTGMYEDRGEDVIVIFLYSIYAHLRVYQVLTEMSIFLIMLYM